jgi:hypothetical protein
MRIHIAGPTPVTIDLSNGELVDIYITDTSLHIEAGDFDDDDGDNLPTDMPQDWGRTGGLN